MPMCITVDRLIIIIERGQSFVQQQNKENLHNNVSRVENNRLMLALASLKSSENPFPY